MSVLFDFFTSGHDVRLVALAAGVCLVSAYACMSLLHHARRATGRMRLVWNGVAALAVGFGIWVTHFIAVVAYRPGFVWGYDLGLTAASLGIAVLVCGLGLALAIRAEHRWDHLLGGAVVGVGISAMHYTGIAALVMGGTIGWNGALVGTSILAGIVLGAASVLAASAAGKWARLGGAGLLTLAICAMHFTAMGAADFARCFPLSAGSQINTTWLAAALAGISLLILGAAFGSVVLDEADRRRTERETQRQLLDAQRINEVSGRLELAMAHMAQGLAMFDADGVLRLHNRRFALLLGLEQDIDLVGTSFREAFRQVLLGATADAEELEEMVSRLHAQHLPLVRSGGEIVHELVDQRTLRIDHSPISDGGWLTTIDDITERQRSQAAIQHLAMHDSLTGLPNRANFNERFDGILAELEHTDSNLAVVAIDLDRFKEINDTYGHAVGDLALRTVAGRLMECLRDGELVARLGGDEFGALKRFTSMEALRDFLQRLEAAMFTRIETGTTVVETAGSLGVAIYPDDGDDRSKLLNNADMAMYRAKAEFDRHIAYYESEMDEHARQRRAMARDIWAAVEQGAFRLAYQVQKAVATGEVTGYEVLLRWDRPLHGPVSPADFIPVAEECGAITSIGDWVLRTACREAARWPEPYKIAVNISALQLGQVELVDTVRSALLESGLSPKRLELEVTETSIITDKNRALHILRQIKAMGVSIAIDDFGTGYSSLDTLRSFPFDKIKLDRSFMQEVEQNEQSKAIVRAILALGRSLSVPVLAEGVETMAQLEVLRAEGCNEAQGFLLGRPGAIDWDDLLELPVAANG
ncbi:EAL domain-containing protein [Devosia albogilva]|uniref:EAL domain-containing protein n=1 Tax=Devosia albogilva TaxID=429726 RepID=A0ABW5QNH0_9HYPH